MDICFQGFRVCLTYDLKSQTLFLYLFFVTALSPRDQRLKHTILWSTDSERVGGSRAVSRNSKGLDMYVQREISEATWAGPAMPLKVSLQRTTVHAVNFQTVILGAGKTRLQGTFFHPSGGSNTHANEGSQLSLGSPQHEATKLNLNPLNII